MAYLYNITSIASGNSTLGFLQGINQELEGFFGIMILLALCSIAFMAFYRNTRDPVGSIAATAFISFGLSILMAAIELVSSQVVFVTITAAAASLAYSWQKGDT